MNRPTWRVCSPEGYVVIETASCEYEARQKASSRPGFEDIERLRVEYCAPPAPPPSVASGRARTFTQAWLQEHKEWKRD